MILREDRNFPQAKLDSEINVLFLLNEHGDLYYLLLNNTVHMFKFSDHTFTHLAVARWQDSIDVSWTEILNFFLTSYIQFLFTFGQCVDNGK